MKLKTLSLNPMTLAITIAFSASAHAAGTGQIVSGTGSITQNQNNTVINQNTDKMVINWDNMNIDHKETMQFLQPNQNSAVLNRINSVDPTLIQGALTANGQVFIVNPNGVLISNGATINVGSLVASSLNINDTDFMKGNFNLSGGGEGKVSNEGSIVAKDSVALIGAGEVSNTGNIKANNGNVKLSAGEDITLSFPSMGKINVKINKGSLKALVNNGGIIVTPNGSIALTAWATDTLTRNVINNTGTLEANQVVMRTDGVYLESIGNGDIDIAGNISGNTISANANNVNVKNNAVLKGSYLTELVANKENGYVKLGKSTHNGEDLTIHADNVLTEGSGNEPTFSGTKEVNIFSGSNDLTVGEKSIHNPEQLIAGKSTISENLVNSISKGKSKLNISSKAKNINLDNDTLDYGDMTVSNFGESGNVNLKSTAKGNSLHVYANNSFEQSQGAEINMANSVNIATNNNLTQRDNITAGNSIHLQSNNGDVTQVSGKNSISDFVSYKGAKVKIDGNVIADSLSLRSDHFSQGSQSSLIAKNATLDGGNYDLTLGKTKLDNIFLSSSSFNINTDSDMNFVYGSYIFGDLNIHSPGDIKLARMFIAGSANINANNIITSDDYSSSYLQTSNALVLNAKNNINLDYIQSDSHLTMSGKSITSANINVFGNATLTSGEDLKIGSINTQGKTHLTAQKNINIEDYLSSSEFNANAKGSVYLNEVNSNNDVNISAVKDVVLNGNVFSDGNITISGENINTVSSMPWYGPIIESMKNIVLNAKNNINTHSLSALGDNYQGSTLSKITLSGKNISAYDLHSSGELNVNAEENILSDGDIFASDVNLNAKGKIQVNNIQSLENIKISANNDVNYTGILSADRNVNISGDNISSYSPGWDLAEIHSGQDTKLIAKNTINVDNITAQTNYWSPVPGGVYIKGKDVLANRVTAATDVTIIADNKINMIGIEAMNVNLSARNNIKANEVYGMKSVNATSTAGRIIFDTLYATRYKNLKAGKGVFINYDENSHWWHHYH